MCSVMYNRGLLVGKDVNSTRKASGAACGRCKRRGGGVIHRTTEDVVKHAGTLSACGSQGIYDFGAAVLAAILEKLLFSLHSFNFLGVFDIVIFRRVYNGGGN